MPERRVDIRGLLRRTYVTAGFIAAAVALCVWAYVGAESAVMILLGAPVGMLFLAALDFTVHRTVVEPQARPTQKWPYTLIVVGKYAVAAGIMYAVSRRSMGLLPYLAAGYSIPVAVLVLKVLGTELNRRVGVGSRGSQERDDSEEP